MAPLAVIGADEVGLGAWAGPLMVCAVAVGADWKGPSGLKDSKQLSPGQRVFLYGQLQHLPMAVKLVENTQIDRFGLRPMLKAAHVEALQEMRRKFPDSDVIVDGDLDLKLPWARSLVKADTSVPAVMAAAIVAKVNRDFVMHQYHEMYPHYGFLTNSGYHSEVHVRGLNEHGVCPLHRRSIAPIRKLLSRATP